MPFLRRDGNSRGESQEGQFIRQDLGGTCVFYHSRMSGPAGPQRPLILIPPFVPSSSIRGPPPFMVASSRRFDDSPVWLS